MCNGRDDLPLIHSFRAASSKSWSVLSRGRGKARSILHYEFHFHCILHDSSCLLTIT